MHSPTVRSSEILFHRIRLVSGLGILLDGYNLSIIAVTLIPLTRQFHLAAGAMGLLASATLAGSILGGMSAGVLADRYGRKTLLIWDLVIFILFSAISSLAVSYLWVVLARFVVGLAVGADYAISPTYVAEFALPESRGFHMGYIWLAWSVGAVGSFGLGALVVDSVAPGLSWRLLFALAVIPAAVGLIMRHQLPESPRWLQLRLNREKPASRSSRSPLRLWILAMVPWFLLDFTSYGLGLLLPLLLKSNNLTSTTGSILGTGLAALFGGLGTWWAMPRLDRLGRIRIQMRGFFLSGLVLFVLAVSLWLHVRFFLGLLAGLMVANFFSGSGPGTTCGIIPAEIFPTPQRATALGAATAFSRIGAIAGVFVLGFAEVHFHFGGVLAIAGLASVLGAVVTWYWRIEPNQTALPDSL
ncbi:MAG: MFS transporter [Firmicutes bacterium]|jgi:putative MFS transporter|uniref:Major facilitator superfamily (MFS) profile domain-containing protein n=1 Tax=Sulfobacillus benefaciens TaxID=453960 RepID=A0A2T2X4H3_9FIRM|nr:MFS transporter [Bacillota bacterium]MCL5013699.1 MFS transporter [Bacillota bacterium]PSR29377.1 MAG: hypothetical protein C7B43_08530 [Sulfobacillus benefaciens]